LIPIDQRPIEVAALEGGVHAVRFLALGSPCEILVAAPGPDTAARWARPGIEEAWRIERKFSRYRDDSVIAAMNAGRGDPVPIDAETRRLIDFAAHCYTLSGGLFDITSGVLRRAWNFDRSDRLPDPALVAQLRTRVGFGRIVREAGAIRVPSGMELDLGGIAKEYAVDRALEAIEASGMGGAPAVLVNFGGDLRANHTPDARPWQVGVEDAASGQAPAMVVELARGALATSGDAHRFLLRDGVRYGHILDPRTGWPVRDAPHAVTVAAASCVEAGTLSTIAMLQGAGAEKFLEGLGVRYWCQRG
jgi:FAD:protein FMN transferase